MESSFPCTYVYFERLLKEKAKKSLCRATSCGFIDPERPLLERHNTKESIGTEMKTAGGPSDKGAQLICETIVPMPLNTK